MISGRLPVITSKHDKSVTSSDSSACSARQHLIRSSHCARELHIHVGFVRLKVVKVEVSKVVN